MKSLIKTAWYILVFSVTLVFGADLKGSNAEVGELLKEIKPLKLISTKGKDQVPRYGIVNDPPWNYHVCKKCKSLDGGCYPKNSISRFRTTEGKDCVHIWTLISKEDFSKLWKASTDQKQPY